MGKKKKGLATEKGIKGEASVKACGSSRVVLSRSICCPSLKALVPSTYEITPNDVEIENPGAVVRMDLDCEDLYGNMIFGINSMFTPEECMSWIALGEKLGYEESKHAASVGYAHRDNGRIAVHNEEIAKLIWLRVKHFVPALKDDGKRAYGVSPNIRLYRYYPDQRFGKHIDESCKDEASGGFSEYTLLVYLNGSGEESGEAIGEDLGKLSGGETIFYKGNTGSKECARVSPKTGLLILHEHGDACMIHEGARVRTGVKYLLRSDVVYI
eukprot:CAMPEP_0204840190 /NCGR_PEP_ID=MMETSP1346-20131115/36746_1 /ASSEMBLY_ACC=CAM_ASM_000771 /TAXON_ID=215587 /ORGANISM="Aplanochytrium stocchinoi, Strain GSBS06" /LENGTH=269 /DNA_ID=CAMNT_0051977435 /DNA_START=110 /DNA_END=919 /DNA_ORIENTATION=+